MNAYLENPYNRIPKSSRIRSWKRGNLNKELLKKSAMTWKNFENALRFLNPVSVEFIVKLTWRNGRVTTHELNVNLSPNEDDV